MDGEGALRGDPGREVVVADRHGPPSIDTVALTPAQRSRRRSPWVLASWIAVPLGCAVWVAANSTQYYPVFDEWVMVDRAVHESILRDLLLGFNGHMWSLAAAVYNAQVRLFGLESNWILPALLVVSLVALQLSLAGVLFRLGLPTPVALAAATVVTYFGPASETMVYQHLFAYNFALALSCAAAFVALGRRHAPGTAVDNRRDRRHASDRHDRRAALLVAALLLAALPCDSALAIGGLIFVAALVLFLWPFRLAVLTLVLPVGGHATWYVLDNSQALVHGRCLNCVPFTFSVSLGKSVEFAVAIITRSAGGLVGGSVTAGVAVLLLATGCTAFGLATHRLSRPVIASLVGGVLAALVSVGLFAHSRAGFWPSIDEAIDSLDSVSNRYVQPAAIFLMLGFGPAIYATLMPRGRTARSVFTGAVTVALVLVFVVNLGSVWPTRDFYRGWSTQVRTQLREAVAVVSEGCGPGQRPNPEAQPVDASFQITERLIEDLLDRGALHRDFGTTATPQMRARICTSA